MGKPKHVRARYTVRQSVATGGDPFAEGFNARAQGRPKVCPYRKQKRAAWFAGWEHAEKEGAGD